MSAKIGIVGAGGIAPAHIKALAPFPERCKIVAICDLVPEQVKAKADEFNITGYSDHRKMIESESLDAVIICTPPAAHEKIAIDVVEMGCNILCEKPLAMKADSGRRMVEAADKAGVLFMVAFCHRFEEAILKIKQSITSGEFGPVTSYRNVFANAAGHRPTRGGNLMDNGSHATDLARYLIGDPVKVLAAQFRPKRETDLDKVIDFSALLEGPNGEMIYLEAGGRHAGGRFFVEVCGEKTSALFDYTSDKKMKWNSDKKWTDIDLPNMNGRFAGQAEHFLDCLEGKTSCITDIHEAQKTLELLSEIEKAALK